MKLLIKAVPVLSTLLLAVTSVYAIRHSGDAGAMTGCATPVPGLRDPSNYDGIDVIVGSGVDLWVYSAGSCLAVSVGVPVVGTVGVPLNGGIAPGPTTLKTAHPGKAAVPDSWGKGATWWLPLTWDLGTEYPPITTP